MTILKTFSALIFKDFGNHQNQKPFQNSFLIKKNYTENAPPDDFSDKERDKKQKKPPGEVLSGRQDMNLKNGTRFLFLRVILQEPSQPQERPRQEQAEPSQFPRESRPPMSRGLPSPQGTGLRPSRKSRTERPSFLQAGLQSS